MKDQAAHACRALCRARVAEELQRRRGTRIGEHLKMVRSRRGHRPFRLRSEFRGPSHAFSEFEGNEQPDGLGLGCALRQDNFFDRADDAMQARRGGEEGAGEHTDMAHRVARWTFLVATLFFVPPGFAQTDNMPPPAEGSPPAGEPPMQPSMQGGPLPARGGAGLRVACGPRVPGSHALLEQCDVLVIRHVSSSTRLPRAGHQLPGPLGIDVGERLPAGVAHDEAGVGLLDGPGRREAALMVGQGGNAA